MSNQIDEKPSKPSRPVLKVEELNDLNSSSSKKEFVRGFIFLALITIIVISLVEYIF